MIVARTNRPLAWALGSALLALPALAQTPAMAAEEQGSGPYPALLEERAG